eukprot:gene4929-6897_t
MERFFLFFCFRSCLRGDNNNEYYDVLEINSSASPDTIKKAFKKLSLSLHPDKLAQRGEEVTAEHKQKFLKVKEAYDVLSDPKRKKLYDELGPSGLKLVENPSEVNPMEILKNFQSNRQDRCSIMLLIAFIFASILLLPILFSLKCDGDLGKSAPWLAIWTPMWIVDLFLLISAVIILYDNSEPVVDPENPNAPVEEKIPLMERVLNFITTTLFILIQIFFLMRLDHVVDWSWFKVFIPWFLYEFFTASSLLHTAFIVTIPPPDHSAIVATINEDGTSAEEELFIQKVKLESEYFEKLMQQKNFQKSVLVSGLRAWLGVFLALKLDGSRDWNWGLVLLPIWLYLFIQYVYAIVFRLWGNDKLVGINPEALISGEDSNPMSVIKFQQGKELHAQSSFLCSAQIFPLLMAILLVCRLQTSSHYSTFIIIIPIFLTVGCCCCFVFCGICCLSNLDMSAMAEAAEKQNQSSDPNGDNSQNYEPPIVPVDPKEDSKTSAPISAEYGTFATNDVSNTSSNHNATTNSHVESTSAFHHTTGIDADID